MSILVHMLDDASHSLKRNPQGAPDWPNRTKLNKLHSSISRDTGFDLLQLGYNLFPDPLLHQFTFLASDPRTGVLDLALTQVLTVEARVGDGDGVDESAAALLGAATDEAQRCLLTRTRIV